MSLALKWLFSNQTNVTLDYGAGKTPCILSDFKQKEVTLKDVITSKYNFFA